MGSVDPIVLDDDVNTNNDNSAASDSSSVNIIHQLNPSPAPSLDPPVSGPSPSEPSSSHSRPASPTLGVTMDVEVQDADHGRASTDLQAPVAGSISAASQSPQPAPADPPPPEPLPQSSAPPPQSLTAQQLTSEPASTGTTSHAAVKPKSTKQPARQRSKSPSPLPQPPPPRITIRLTIPLGGPDNYAVDISELARGTGQRPPTPPPPKRDTSESEGEEADAESVKVKGKQVRKKKNLASEYYDLNDPFIDDSDLAIDERTWFAQTKQQGFYVSSGEVALLKDKSGAAGLHSPGRKPKSRKAAVPPIVPLTASSALTMASGLGRPSNSTTTSTAAAASAMAAASLASVMSGAAASAHSVTNGTTNSVSANGTKHEGTRESPIPLLSDAEDAKPNRGDVSMQSVDSLEAGALKRKTSQETGSPKKKRKVEIESFHPTLQVALQDLKAAIAKESFEQKGKFPPSLKPILASVALTAIKCGEYNDAFFSLMPKLFIYNKFTMTKLIKRTVYPQHQALLVDRQQSLLDELATLVQEGFAKVKEDYEKSVISWEKRQEKAKADTNAAGGTSAEGTPIPGTHPSTAANDSALDGESGMDADAQASNNNNNGNANANGNNNNNGNDGNATGTAKEGKETPPPSKKYRLSERMKGIIWELVILSNEGIRIENEKNQYENSMTVASEQGARKILYQKIVAAFPEGWMSSGQISRDVSVMKKRFEALQAEEVV